MSRRPLRQVNTWNVEAFVRQSNKSLKKPTRDLKFYFLSVTSGDDSGSGMLEGILRGQKGFFPSQCVQEVRLRNPHSVKQAITTAPRASSSASTTALEPRGNLDNANLSGNQRHFATAQRPKDFM